MILQNIILPSTDTCTAEKMYFRKKGQVEYILSKEELSLFEGASLHFDTYFNGFSFGKWSKYTNIRRVYVTLRFQGELKIVLLRKEIQGQQVFTYILHEEILESDGQAVTLEFPETATPVGMFSFELTAVRNSRFYGGYYWTDIEEENIHPVKIALDICTFRREPFVLKNIDLLNRRIFHADIYQNLKDNLEVFIIDNAATLKEEEVVSEKIHLIPNKNVGGAGGFTRGMIEIKKREQESGFTHVLLMDDDIVIETESLFRTFALLSLVKEQYREAFVGGAMLRLDDPFIQVESGAKWNSGYLVSRKNGLDLQRLNSCLLNEIEEGVDYCAWWYCTIPLCIVREDNLPLPLFIRGDDVEYGLRNAEKIILMNGICVWHEPFENKYSSSVFYYILRNRLIDNAIHNCALSQKEFIYVLRKQVLVELYLFRYKNVRLLLRGVEDYLKGVDWLKAQDGEQLHKEIMAAGYKMQYAEEINAVFDYQLYQSTLKEPENASFFHRVVRRFTFNGTLLPAKKGYTVIPVVEGRIINTYRAGCVLNYDRFSQKSFLTPRDKIEAWECIKLLYETIRQIKKMYAQVNEEYHTRGRELMSMDFWRGYLDLDSQP